MNILMINTPSSPNLRGGDTVQMQKTAEALRASGLKVEECIDLRPSARGFDVAHVFNLRTIQATTQQVDHLHSQGIPIVLSPIYLNVSLAIWGTEAVGLVFSEERAEPEQAAMLEQLARREVQLRHEDGTAWTAFSENRNQPDYDQLQRAILRKVQHLAPNSVLEMQALVRTLGVYDLPFTIIPYGVDEGVFLNPDPEPFVEEYGLRDFVLQVGRLELPKNQVMLCEALRDFELPLVLIGHHLNRAQAEMCRRRLPRGGKMIPHLPPQKLAAAYAAAAVHALPSWVETCGLVTLEAALADCSLVVSTAGYELEYFGSDAYYCDPADVRSIRAAVEKAVARRAQDAPLRKTFRQKILEQFTWHSAARCALLAYERVLSNR